MPLTSVLTLVHTPYIEGVFTHGSLYALQPMRTWNDVELPAVCKKSPSDPLRSLNVHILCGTPGFGIR
jgi:hypothetical protein